MNWLTALGMTLLILKLLSVPPVSGWSWWWVLLPFYLPAAIVIAIVIAVLILACVFVTLSK